MDIHNFWGGFIVGLIPPVFIDNPTEARAWPRTKRGDWCGEIQEGEA